MVGVGDCESVVGVLWGDSHVIRGLKEGLLEMKRCLRLRCESGGGEG